MGHPPFKCWRRPDVKCNKCNQLEHEVICKVDREGFKVHFEEKYCLTKDTSSQEMFKVKMIGKSFTLDPLEEEQIAFLIRGSVIEIWHKWLGHYHHHRLLLLQTKQLVRDLPILEDHLPHCQAANLESNTSNHFQKQLRKQCRSFN
ncbi:hypothetical protein CR513_36417, partial [Mucuna pruriens]